REIAHDDYDLVVDILCKLPFCSPWILPIPCLGIVHHLFGRTAFEQVPFPVAAATYLSEKLIPHAYRDTALITISPSSYDDLVARGLDGSHISIIPNGVDETLYNPGAGAKDERPLIVWLGRVEPYKRADLLIEAMPSVRARVPTARLAVVGDGTARPALEDLVRKRQLTDCVEFTGFVTSEEKVAYLRRAHALVNTSEKEGWGLTVIEGNACGTPTIATNVPGLRDSVRDGETGLLVEYGNIDQLADALVRVLSDEALRMRLSRNALEWSRRFVWDEVASQIEQIAVAVADGACATEVRLIAPVFGGVPNTSRAKAEGVHG
ncbi:MAG: glycosyltransferase family 1 protein, partial [Candidatus Dadabacteria bacterium]